MTRDGPLQLIGCPSNPRKRRRDPTAPTRIMGSRSLGEQLAEMREKRRQAAEAAEQSAKPTPERPYGDPALVAQHYLEKRKAYARRTKKA